MNQRKILRSRNMWQTFMCGTGSAKADVEVYVDKPELETYMFSLRHEYRVTSVEDECGNS